MNLFYSGLQIFGTFQRSTLANPSVKLKDKTLKFYFFQGFPQNLPYLNMIFNLQSFPKYLRLL